MSKRYPDPLLESLRLLELKKHMRILDVGCGSGAMIYTLGSLGFARVLGIDPFIDEDRVYGNGTEIRKQSLSELDERFDVIMFHHSFEHMDDPASILGNVARLLDDGGTCVINTPNANSDAWENYGTDWVQLDAPRHLFIHSPEGLAGLATRAGLEVRDVRWNSTAFQFWGSEQYRLGIPLNDPKSHAVDTATSPFSAEQIRLWDARARELNEARRGDQFAAYLVKR
jgi:cyclopropane fatty-acyl-phospholipid synthase-like methyltransferase